MKLVSGNSNKPLAESIAQYLGVKLVDATIKKFPDKEIFVEIHENVRGEDVFVVQSTSFPANDHVMELLITIDALKRGSAKRIAAIMPYYGYARQDRKSGPRTPISAKLLANLISIAGADRALMVDLHAGQIQGFFDIPTDNLFAAPVFIEDIKNKFSGKDFVIISPDVGGVVRARAIAKRVDCDLAIIDKRREKASVSEVMNIIGEIRNKHCILIDDICDTAGTLTNAAKALKDKNAKSVYAYITHGVLSEPAIERINNSPIDKMIITDSILAREDIRSSNKIEQLSIAPLIGEAIGRITENKSVSSLFAWREYSMSENSQLIVSKRENSGTGNSRSSRLEKKIPGIIYGDKKDPIPVLLDEKVLKVKIKDPTFFSKQCEIKFNDQVIKVLPKDLQLHPVKESILHIDFLRVGENTTVTLLVPVKFINENSCPGIKQGGVLNVVRREIELITLVSKIPESLEANLDGLEIGDSIHISSINLDEGVRPAISDRDFTIATIAPPTVMKVEEEKPVEEAGEGAEGAEAKEGSDQTKQEPSKDQSSEDKKSDDNAK